MRLSNEEFLRGIFGDATPFVHVTSFPDDPANISDKRRAKCWSGGWFRNTPLNPSENCYFAISIFKPDAEGKARRRKALFYYTCVIVADDVREKLPIDRLLQLPPPSYKLMTSPGSEQWAWILSYPCTDMALVDNLLDGLVKQGLAPDGKDPGMRGPTRYVRLPNGVNTKASRVAANRGTPPPCRLLEWHPERRYTMEQLARPFAIDLAASRRDCRVDGAAEVADHPLLQVPDLIVVKKTLSPGRYDITCPWVDGHTEGADDGAAVFTNQDGSFGYKCHHGSCQHRTGKDLMDYVEASMPGFRQQVQQWQTLHAFRQITGDAQPIPPSPVTRRLSFLDPPPAAPLPASPPPSYQDLIDALRAMPPDDDRRMDACYQILDVLRGLDAGRLMLHHDQIREIMGWSKQDLRTVIETRARERRRLPGEDALSFYNDEVFVSSINQFYNRRTGVWMAPETFQNAYCHIDEECRSNALVNGRCKKVVKIDFRPDMPEFWSDEETGAAYLNTWREIDHGGRAGDCSPWLDHLKRLGWNAAHIKHFLQWCAYTLRHPERKINHILLLAGGEGIGKNWLLLPLVNAMRSAAREIAGEELLNGFNEYLLGTKLLVINESELGDRVTATQVYNKLKLISCAPPNQISIDVKNVRRQEVTNIVNLVMTSNSLMPLKVSHDTRRLYALWSDITTAGLGGNAYWPPLWEWMRDRQGWRACVHYLLNEVSLAGFDPGATPETTEFLQEMRGYSEDPVVATLREAINSGMGVFAADLLAMHDITAALRLDPDINKLPSPTVIGRLIKQGGLGDRIEGKEMVDGRQRDLVIYVIRNRETYQDMGRTALVTEYRRQMAAIASNRALTLVQGGKG